MMVLRFTGEGEVFFAQSRHAVGGGEFKLLKFATMLKNSPNMASGTVTLKNDPRVLPFGKFLRKTKINELPQLLNVLRGEMSIIGPRPQTPRCFDAFPIKSQNEIIRVLPGLSGIGSIVFRGEEDMTAAADDPDYFYDAVIMPYKGSLEEWFVRNKNLKTYMVLILLTIVVVIRPKSQIIWSAFPNIPEPPDELKEWVVGRVL